MNDFCFLLKRKMAARAMALHNRIIQTMLKSLYLYVVLSLFVLNFCFCLYEDQVGLFDWKQKYIGSAKQVYFDSNPSRNQRAYISTNSNVLAALNVKTGNILWRKIFSDKDTIHSFLQNSNVLLTISGSSRTVRSWESKNGNLLWESSSKYMPSPLSLELPRLPQIMAKKKAMILEDDTVFIQTETGIRVVSSNDGSEIWNYVSNDSFVMFGVHKPDSSNIIAFGIAQKDSKTFVTIKVLDAESGSLISEREELAKWVLTADVSCDIILTSLLCVIPSKNQIAVINLNDNHSDFELKSLVLENNGLIFTLPGTDKAVIKTGDTSTLITLNTDLSSIKILKQSKLSGFYTAADISNKKYIFEIVKNLDKNSFTVEVFDFENLDESIPAYKSTILVENFDQGNIAPPQNGVVYTYPKNKEFSYRILLTCKDDSLSLLQNVGNNEGKLLWSRDEALSKITNVKMLELPPSASAQQLALLHDEFSIQQNVGIFKMFANRIKAQIRQLQTFTASLKKSQHFGATKDNQEKVMLKQDQFNIIKVILLMTKSNRLFALNSKNGDLIWSRYLPLINTEEKIELIEQRSSAHFPLPPQFLMVAITKDARTIVYQFDPLTGNGLQEPLAIEPNQYLQVAKLPIEDDKATAVVCVVSSAKTLSFYPDGVDSRSKLKAHINTLYIYLANKTTNSFKGYKIKDAGQTYSLFEVWSINIPANQKLVQLAVKDNDEVINSVGRVLGDHSVLYKYINPNLVAFMTQQFAGTKSGSVFVYLADTVTGHVIYSANHRGAEPPLDLILSEHWLLYSYMNSKARRSEVSVVEFYEGYEEKNNTAFSSHDPGTAPMVLSQGYYLPVSGVRVMSSTTTLRGITTKNIMFGLENGRVYSLPKQFFDPRRSYKMTTMLKEEGVMPYIPELPVNPMNYINYNQTVTKIRGIHSAPAGLESTSLVLVYGLDVYFTRVMPSKMFDVLKEDFDYILISVVLSALIIASVVCGKLATMKSLKAAWK